MPSPSELLSRGFSMGGKVKYAELASIAAGLNASGRYSRRGNNRRANEAPPYFGNMPDRTQCYPNRGKRVRGMDNLKPFTNNQKWLKQ